MGGLNPANIYQQQKLDLSMKLSEIVNEHPDILVDSYTAIG